MNESAAAANIGKTTMGTWIKCTDERGQIIYVNIDNAITLLRNEAQHRGTVIAFMWGRLIPSLSARRQKTF
jgi:hypothetical protein